jgi:transcriptional regulator with XRE-family HTH domain
MSESIGAALRSGREQRRLTLAQVSEATRIRMPYLQALENDDLSAMPSAAQARGFMRIYAEFLELDLEALIPPPAAVLPADAAATPMAETPTTPSGTTMQAEAGATASGLLSNLRDRLARRLRTPARADNAEPPAAPEAPAKKKARNRNEMKSVLSSVCQSLQAKLQLRSRTFNHSTPAR